MLERIKISVRDLEASRALYLALFDLVEAGAGPVDLSGYGLASGRSVFLKLPSQGTMIELTQVEGGARQPIRGERNHDYGVYDIAFIVKDLAAHCAFCRERGLEPLSDPVRYEADWVKLTVQEAIFRGPDGERLALAEIVSDPVPQFEGRVGMMVDVGLMVQNQPAEAAFYTEFGCVQSFERLMPGGMVNRLLGVPADADVRIAAMRSGSGGAAVELIQCSAPGQRLDTTPANHGMYGLGFRVEALPDDAVPVDDPLLGATRRAMRRSPSGVWVELLQG